jgi:hypothetical protein
MCDEGPNQSLQSEKEDQLEIGWRHFSLVVLIRLKPGCDIIARMSSLKFAIPSLTELRTVVEEKFNIRPCIFQANAALAQLEQKDSHLRDQERP